MSTRKPKGSYHHRDLRRALVDGAIALIAERGADALSLREVARRAGVSHAASYRHFADKQALLATVAEEGFRGMEGLMDELMGQAGDDPLRLAEACGLAYVRYGLEHPAHFHVMFTHQIEKGSGKFPGLDEASGATFGRLLAAVALGQTRGVLRGTDPMPIAVSAWSLVHGLTHLLVESLLPAIDEPDVLARRAVEHLLDGVRAQPRAVTKR